jgi:Rha family phage regulatory protein
MASNEISVLVSEGKAVVGSREVALRFQKKHAHILREIERIKALVPREFSRSNFGLAEYTDEQGKPRPAYLLTRDAFSLLAMGFTGKAAIIWKLKYIEAFNALEATAAAALRGQIEAVRDAALAEGRMSGLALHRRTTPERKALMRRALRYKGMGLGSRDSGKLMDCSRQLVCSLLKDAAMLGMEVRHGLL